MFNSWVTKHSIQFVLTIQKSWKSLGREYGLTSFFVTGTNIFSWPFKTVIKAQTNSLKFIVGMKNLKFIVGMKNYVNYNFPIVSYV